MTFAVAEDAPPGPTISVITVCFRSERTIGHTIDSVNAQSYPHIEHVFIDGASTDNTLGVIKAHSQRVRRVLSEPDRGIYDALNKGLCLAKGDVVGFLHADDFFAHSDVLAHVAAQFADPAVGGVYGDLQYVSETDPSRVIRHWKAMPFSRWRLRLGWMPPHPTLYVRKPWYDRIGGFDTRYRIAADYFSILQLFTHPEFKTSYLPKVLVKMRAGGVSNRSLKNILLKSREDLDALRRSRAGGLATLAAKNLRKLGQFF